MTIPPRLQRLLPFLRWLPYGGATLRADFIAGLTGAVIVLPQGVAFATIDRAFADQPHKPQRNLMRIGPQIRSGRPDRSA